MSLVSGTGFSFQGLDSVCRWTVTCVVYLFKLTIYLVFGIHLNFCLFVISCSFLETWFMPVCDILQHFRDLLFCPTQNRLVFLL